MAHAFGGRFRNSIVGALAGLRSLGAAVLASPGPMPEAGETTGVGAGASGRFLIRAWLLPVASLLVLYLAFSTAYNMSVPLFEAPDEPAHIGYIDSLQRTGRIPQITQETYVAVGPPLYHGVGAAVLKVLSLSPPGPSPSIANDFPYEGQALSIHVLRGVSTLFGAATVVLVYLIALLVFPERKLLAWAAAANTALLPQLLFTGGAVMNDTCTAFLDAAAVYSILRVVKLGQWSWVFVAGGSLGLGFLTEASTLVVALVCALALLFSPLPWRQRGLALAVLVASPVLLASWYYIYNIVEYGDYYPDDQLPLLGPPLALTDGAYRGPFQQTLFDSYWYTGGPMSIRVVGAMYQFLNVFAGMAIGGFIAFIARGQLSSLQQRGLFLLTVLLLLTVFEVIWISMTISYQPQGRYLFVAQPAIALFLALGINALFQRDSKRDNAAVLLLPAILFGLNLGILTLTLPTVY